MIEIFEKYPMAYYFGYFKPKCMNYCDIWYEYYEPKEFHEFTDHGIDMPWIEKNIYPFIDANTEMYYCVKNEIKTDREFTYVKCQVKINKHLLNGYIFLDVGEINAVSFNIGKKRSQFLSKKMLLYETNNKTIKKISKKLNIDMSGIKMIELIIDEKIKKAFSLSTSLQIID